MLFEQILEAAPYKTEAAQPFTFHLTNHLRWARYAGDVMFSYGLPYMDTPVLVN